MSRFGDAKRMWDGWKARYDGIEDTEEKALAVIISLVVVGLLILFVLFLIWAVLSFFANFWPVFLGGALGWYFWPRIRDAIKKRG